MLKIGINHTAEDYLRAIYRLEEREGNASNAALARELGISAAAVSEMVKKMGEMKLVRYRKYHGTKLTPKGKSIAVGITRKHRLWEVFLIEHLNFAWDQVHELAHQLEHINSEELIDRLDDFLGNPTHDPHGDLIPAKDGTVPQRDLVPLSAMEPGWSGSLRRVSDEHPELLRYAASLGLEIGRKVTVLERINFDGSVRLVSGDKESVVSEKLAASLYAQINVDDKLDERKQPG